ncbi:MAG: 16S rRNA (uracil(1498)-N(3))-methyltransferase, partial [uncultured Rubellimicrobium sp.]
AIRRSPPSRPSARRRAGHPALAGAGALPVRGHAARARRAPPRLQRAGRGVGGGGRRGRQAGRDVACRGPDPAAGDAAGPVAPVRTHQEGAHRLHRREGCRDGVPAHPARS